MTTVAFCGLGQMGARMAARLIAAGHDVAVWNRSPGPLTEPVEQGARAEATPADAAAGAEVAITMLANPAAVEQVVLGDEGLASGLAPGATLIEMSTIGPAAVHRLREALPEHLGLLDAPVLGSLPGAAEGTLKVFVGGDAGLYQRWQPLLAELGTPQHLGPQGAGAAMKLVANSCLGVLMVGLGEALALADAFDLDTTAVLDVLAESPIGVTVKSKRTLIESDEWQPNFKLSLALKDLRLVVEAAESAGVDLRLAPEVAERLAQAEAAGRGDDDYSAVIAEIRR